MKRRIACAHTDVITYRAQSIFVLAKLMLTSTPDTEMMKAIIAPLLIVGSCLLLPNIAVAEDKKKATKWPDCYCVNRGGVRHELGDQVCLYVDGRSFLARCEMSLNNPSWKEISDICPTAALPQSPGLPRSLAAEQNWPS